MGHWTTDTIIHSMYHCTCICHRLRWPMGTSSSAAAGKHEDGKSIKKKNGILLHHRQSGLRLPSSTTTRSFSGALLSYCVYGTLVYVQHRVFVLRYFRHAIIKKRYRMDRALPFPLIHDSFFKFQSLFAPVVKFTSAWSNPQRLTRIIIKGKHFFNVTTVFPSLPLPLRVPPDCSKTSYFSIQG